MKLWPIKFPTYQYKEDVVKLAKKNDLEIIDARFVKDIPSDKIAKDTPKLTKKGVIKKPVIESDKKSES